ncbi:hypothetical protein BX661DRAFT_179735 [Kickxella alabastrina]|uniref:uncharacterized protein n=1 Tax=Kickxella alabastrina TaxID=61397 RepID=UPI00221F6A68|nr:uncharacterized protein BX661DRAFT_179735 [Kickxella alabastrina]KAI7832061.1 hypothetical protein BX661DRAFT_179735 [Kickxella alabastrina]
MEDSGYDNKLRSPLRPWATATSPSLGHSPRPPKSAHTLRTMILPIQHSRSNSTGYTHTPSPAHTHPRTPMTAQPASFSLAALLENKPPLRADTQQQGREAAAEDKWRRLGARILPLFNGERMQGSVEEANEMVRGCLRSEGPDAWEEVRNIVSIGMASVVRSLYRHMDVAPRFFSQGRRPSTMVSMAGIIEEEESSGERLIEALAAVWEAVFAHVVPYLEAVFLPLRSQFRECVVKPLVPRLADVARAQQGLVNGGLAQVVQMMAMLASLTPKERGPVYDAARALAVALQA